MINLLKALVLAKANFKPLRKEKKSSDHGSYASLDAVLGSVETALLEQDLLISHQLIDNDLVTSLYHVSGERLESVFAIGEISDPQKLGSKLTYFRRYAICSMLSICADEDDDGQAAKTEPVQQSAQQLELKRNQLFITDRSGEYLPQHWELIDRELVIEKLEKLEKVSVLADE